MAKRKTNTQPEILEISKIALQNVESNPVIKPLMAAFGYDAPKIDEGKLILLNTRTKFDENVALEDNKLKVYKDFENKKLAVQEAYARDRKKARVVFRSDQLILKELGLVGTFSKNYVKWLEKVNLFYHTINNQPAIADKLLVMQITPAHIANQLAEIEAVESLKAARTQSEGIAQNATTIKDKAFKELEKWMSTFFATAKIALEDKPQLMESLGIVVKS